MIKCHYCSYEAVYKVSPIGFEEPSIIVCSNSDMGCLDYAVNWFMKKTRGDKPEADCQVKYIKTNATYGSVSDHSSMNYLLFMIMWDVVGLIMVFGPWIIVVIALSQLIKEIVRIIE